MNTIGLVLATERDHALSADRPDALCLLDGQPLVAHAVRALAGAVGEVVVAVSVGVVEEVRSALDDSVPGLRAVVVDGDCVPVTLDGVWRAADVVLVHDVRRPLAPVDLVGRVVAAMRDGVDAVVPVVEVVETVKELDPDGWIVRTVPRDRLRQVQTPRAVRLSTLTVAESEAGAGADGPPFPAPALSDVAGWDPFVAASSHVVTVAGHADAFALRGPADLDLATAILRARRTGP